MIQASDLRITCRECGREFVFTEGEQNFYEHMGFTPPTRCRQCRATKDKQYSQATCTECGAEIPKGSAVYCESCSESVTSGHVTCSRCGVEQENRASLYCEACLSKIKIDSDRKVEKLKKELSVAQSKLQLAEAQNEELQKSLYESKRNNKEMELNIQNISQDLDKAYKYYVASNWLKPALDNMSRRLESLERSCRETNQEVYTELQKVREESESLNLWEVLKRGFRLNRNENNSPA